MTRNLGIALRFFVLICLIVLKEVKAYGIINEDSELMQGSNFRVFFE